MWAGPAPAMQVIGVNMTPRFSRVERTRTPHLSGHSLPRYRYATPDTLTLLITMSFSHSATCANIIPHNLQCPNYHAPQ